MFYYLSGVLTLPEPSVAVIDCGGVGFKLTISSGTLQKLAGKEGQTVKLFTHMDVKEDAMELYGFFTESEQDAFRKLITVSGVGPKAAIAVLSALSPDRLSQAISAGDTKAITAANGVGKKIAERIILELKDKLGVAGLGGSESEGSFTAAPVGDNASDALSALLVLGYSRSEASAAVRAVDPNGKSVEDIIKKALSLLMRQ